MESSIVTAKPFQKKANQYFPALTGLRAVAALIVYLHHVRHNLTVKEHWLYKILQEFNFGVTIFFVLSGFLIAHQYQKALANNQVSLRYYVVQRLGRIMPVYLGLTIVYLLYTHQIDWKIWLLNLTLARALFKEYLFMGVGPAWSLTVEACFYIVAPFAFRYLTRSYSLWWVTLLTICTGILGVLLSNWLHLSSFLSDVDFMLDYTFFGRCFAFYVGMKLAYQVEVISSSNAKMLFWWRLPYKTVMGFGWVFFCILLNVWLRENETYLQDWTSLLVSCIESYIVIPGICLILAGLITERNWLQRVLASKPLDFMGKASYIFYLLHAGLFFEILYFHVSKNTFIIYLVLNLVSIAGFIAFEEPARKYIVRTFAGRDRKNC